MNYSIGCDIEDIKRFNKKVLNKGFLKKVYTEKEREYCLRKANPARHLAVRWCAKEAVIKALSGFGVNSIELTDIEITNNMEGYPSAFVYDTRCNNFEIKISLSHAAGMAMATAIIVLRSENERTDLENFV